MKVPGVSAEMIRIEGGKWYLLEAVKATWRDIAKKPKLDVIFSVLRGDSLGEKFRETFFITEQSMSRLRCFLSRSGYPAELLSQDEVDEEKIVGLHVWAKIIIQEGQDGNSYAKVDGWNFKPESEPPEEEAPGRDYTATDTEESVTAGL
jgi:hypothetical protein